MSTQEEPITSDQETWKDVVGYEGWYKVSDLGRVRRIAMTVGAIPGKILKSRPTRCGHPNAKPRFYVSLSRGYKGSAKNATVHKLVAEAFIGQRPDGCEINHKDGDPSNNKLNNLEYMTRSQNHWHAAEMGLAYRGEKNGMHRLTVEKVKGIKLLLLEGILSQQKIADKFDVCVGTINLIKMGKTWKFVVVDKPINT